MDTKRSTFGVEITFRDTRVGRPDVIFVVECIKFNPLCKVLSFSGCKIVKNRLHRFASYLILIGVLKTLFDSHRNQVERFTNYSGKCHKKYRHDRTLKIFSDIPIHKFTSNNITNLMLKGAGIGAHGAIVLCNLLSRENGALNSLRSMYLSRNNIHTFGAKAFKEVFAVNTTLTFIDLRDNLIEAAAIDEMALGMESNPGIMNLETLDLQDNVIGGYMVSKKMDELLRFANAFPIMRASA